MMIGVLGSLAEYERELVKERTALKRQASRANSTKFGRPKKVKDGDNIATARRMKADGHTARDIAKYFGVSRATLYRYLVDEPAYANNHGQRAGGCSCSGGCRVVNGTAAISRELEGTALDARRSVVRRPLVPTGAWPYGPSARRHIATHSGDEAVSTIVVMAGVHWPKPDSLRGDMRLFDDRVDAGRRLAKCLESLRGQDIVVLGLPRGGVRVAFGVVEGPLFRHARIIFRIAGKESE